MNKFSLLVCALILTACGSQPVERHSEGRTSEQTGGEALVVAETQTAPTTRADVDIDALFEDDKEVRVNDPIEPVNRAMFWFNDKFYLYILKPSAKGFRAVVPEGGRVHVKYFFSNLASPIRAVNNGLQGEGKQAGTEVLRFLINTTLGIAGFFDPASEHFNLHKKDEDFGQTLGSYGAGHGFYLVIPFIGPSSGRDGFGAIVDSFFDPVSYVDETEHYYVVKYVEAMNEVSLDKDTYESIKREQLDPYLFIRDAYIQRREGLIKK